MNNFNFTSIFSRKNLYLFNQEYSKTVRDTDFTSLMLLKNLSFINVVFQ